MNQKEAVILKNLDYKETSKLVYFYTNNGVTSAMAKGAHRKESKVRSLIEPITCVNVCYSDAKLPTLTQIDLVSNFTNIKYDLEKQVYALHILELVYRLTIEVDHQKIYQLLKKTLQTLDRGIDSELVSFVFELKLLFYLGLALDFENITFYTNAKEWIRTLYYIKFDELDVVEINKQDRNQIRKEIDILYSDLLSFRSNARSVLNDIFNYA